MFTRLNFMIHSIASKERWVRAINGVLVTPDYTEATNGHVLMRVDTVSDKETFAPYQVPRKIMAAFCKLVSVKKPSSLVAPNLPSSTHALLDDTHIVLRANDEDVLHELTFKRNDDKWPEVNRAFPTAEPTVRALLSPLLLRDLCKVFAESGAKQVELALWVSEGKPMSQQVVRLTAEVNGQHMCGIVMPLRWPAI